MNRVYDIVIGDQGPYMVVNLVPDKGGPTGREQAIAFAISEAARIGWDRTEVTRVSRTPSGGWSISIKRV